MAKPNGQIKRFNKVANSCKQKYGKSRKTINHPLDKTKVTNGEVGNPKKK